MTDPVLSLRGYAGDFWCLYGEPGRTDTTATTEEVTFVAAKLRLGTVPPDGIIAFLPSMRIWLREMLSRDGEGGPRAIGRLGGGSPISFSPARMGAPAMGGRVAALDDEVRPDGTRVANLAMTFDAFQGENGPQSWEALRGYGPLTATIDLDDLSRQAWGLWPLLPANAPRPTVMETETQSPLILELRAQGASVLVAQARTLAEFNYVPSSFGTHLVYRVYEVGEEWVLFCQGGSQQLWELVTRNPAGRKQLLDDFKRLLDRSTDSIIGALCFAAALPRYFASAPAYAAAGTVESYSTTWWGSLTAADPGVFAIRDRHGKVVRCLLLQSEYYVAVVRQNAQGAAVVRIFARQEERVIVKLLLDALKVVPRNPNDPVLWMHRHAGLVRLLINDDGFSPFNFDITEATASMIRVGFPSDRPLAMINRRQSAKRLNTGIQPQPDGTMILKDGLQRAVLCPLELASNQSASTDGVKLSGLLPAAGHNAGRLARSDLPKRSTRRSARQASRRDPVPPRPSDPTSHQMAVEIKTAAATVGQLRTDKTAALTRVALTLSGGRIGQQFLAAAVPLPILFTLHVAPEGAALAGEMGIAKLSDVLRKGPTVGMTLAITWGGTTGPIFVYALSQHVSGGRLVLTPLQGSPAGRLCIKRDATKNPFLIIPADSALLAWLDHSLYGPRLGVVVNGPAGRVARLDVSAEGPLLAQVRALWQGEIQREEAAGLAVPYLTAHHAAALQFCRALADLYRTSLEQPHPPLVWEPPMVSDVAVNDAGHLATKLASGPPPGVGPEAARPPAPGSTFTEGQTRKRDFNIALPLSSDLTGVQQVVIAACDQQQYKSGKWQFTARTLLSLKWGSTNLTLVDAGEVRLTDAAGNPVCFPLLLDKDQSYPVGFTLLARVSPPNGGRQPPHGFLSAKITIAAGGQATVTDAKVTALPELCQAVPVPLSILTRQGLRADPLTLTLSVYENPLTGAREIARVTLGLDLPDAVRGRLRLSDVIQIDLIPPRALAEGETFELVYLNLGPMHFTLTLDEFGRPHAWRAPLDALHEIEGHGSTAVFKGLSEEGGVEIPVCPLPHGGGRSRGTTEEWYRVVSDAEYAAEVHQAVLVAWLRLMGFGGALPAEGEALALLSRDGRVELTRPFRPHPDGDPILTRYLTPREERTILTAMLDPSLIGTYSNVWRELAPNDSEFRPDDRWRVPPGTVYLLAPEDQQRLLQLRAAGDAEQPLAGTPLNVQFVNGRDDEIAVDVIVVRRGVRRGKNWLMMDPDGRWVMRKSGAEAEHDGTGSLLRQERRGRWRVYPLRDLGGGRVKPFDLRALTHPDDPLVVGLVNALDEDGSAASAAELMQVARAELVAYRHALAAPPLDVPPVMRMRQQVRFEDGRPVELRFICDRAGTAGEAILTGIRIEEGFGKLAFDPLLKMVFSVFADGQMFTREIWLRHQDHPDSGRLILLTEEPPPSGDQAPLRLLFNLEDGTVIPVVPPQGPEQSRAGGVGTGDAQGRLGVPPELRVVTPEGESIDVDLAVPELDAAEQTAPLPEDEKVTALESAEQICALMTRLTQRRRGLAGQTWLPSAETAYAQALVGRPRDSLVFRMRSGHLLLLPVLKVGRQGYRSDHDGDPAIKVAGATILFADPDHKGHYFRLDTEHLGFIHQVLNDYHLIIPGVTPPKGWWLGRVVAEAYNGERVWGLQVTAGDGGKDRVNRVAARRDMRNLVELLGLHAAPTLTTRPTTIDGTPVTLPMGLNAVRSPDGRGYRLMGITVVEGLDGSVASTSYLRDGQPGTFLICRAPKDRALWRLRDLATGEQFFVAFNARGEGLVFPLDPQLQGYYRPIDSHFPMSGIAGPYGRVVSPVHRGPAVGATRETAGSDAVPRINPEWAIAHRDDLSRPEDPIQHFVLTLAMGRWLVANERDVLAGKDPRVAVARIDIVYDRSKTGPDAITVTPLPLQNIGEEREFPWDEHMHVELHESVWEAADQTHYGPINILSWREPVAGERDKKVPYLWVDFASRHRMVGAREAFDVKRAHWNHDFRYRRRKLGQDQTGYLTKRMGVAFQPGPADRYTIATAGGTGWEDGFTRGLFETLGPEGTGALALLQGTRACEYDRPVLLSALWLLHRYHPEWRLVDAVGRVEQVNLESLAAWAAIKLAGLPPEDVLYIPEESGQDIPLLRDGRVTAVPEVLRITHPPEAPPDASSEPASKGSAPTLEEPAPVLEGSVPAGPPPSADEPTFDAAAAVRPTAARTADPAAADPAATSIGPTDAGNTIHAQQRKSDEAFLRAVFRFPLENLRRREWVERDSYLATYLINDDYYGQLLVGIYHDAAGHQSFVLHHLDHARFGEGKMVWRCQRADRLIQQLRTVVGQFLRPGDVLRLTYANRTASGRANWLGRTAEYDAKEVLAFGPEWALSPQEAMRQAFPGLSQGDANLQVTADDGGVDVPALPPVCGDDTNTEPPSQRGRVRGAVYHGRRETGTGDDGMPRISDDAAGTTGAALTAGTRPSSLDEAVVKAEVAMPSSTLLRSTPANRDAPSNGARTCYINDPSRLQPEEPAVVWQRIVRERLTAAGVTGDKTNPAKPYGLSPYQAHCLLHRPDSPLSLRPALLAVARDLRLYHRALLQAMLETSSDQDVARAALGLAVDFFATRGFVTAFPVDQEGMDRQIAARQALIRQAWLGDVSQDALAAATAVAGGDAAGQQEFLTRTGGTFEQIGNSHVAQIYYLFSLGDVISAALHLLETYTSLRLTRQACPLETLFQSFMRGYDAWLRRHYDCDFKLSTGDQHCQERSGTARRFALYRNYQSLFALIPPLQRHLKVAARDRAVTAAEGGTPGEPDYNDDDELDLAGVRGVTRRAHSDPIDLGGLTCVGTAAVETSEGPPWGALEAEPPPLYVSRAFAGLGAAVDVDGVGDVDDAGGEGVWASALASGGGFFAKETPTTATEMTDVLTGPALWGTMPPVVRGWQ